MGTLLIIEQDTAVLEPLQLLLKALDKSYEVASTHSNAVRLYESSDVDAVILNPEMPMVDPKALIDELANLAHEKEIELAPIVCIYTDDALVKRYDLASISGCQLERKPILVERFYKIMKGLGLTEIPIYLESQHLQDKMNYIAEFIDQSEAWLEKLKTQLLKTQ
jgi:DNA-binding response OmpR family regulator